MSVTINLKEIFATDNQEIIVDKLTYNFNQLLTLGVGTPGGIGIRGNYTFAGTDPSGITDPIIHGDIFYDTDSYTIDRYNAVSPAQWETVIDIQQLVNDAVLLSPILSPSFVRWLPNTPSGDNELIGFKDEIETTPPSGQLERDTAFLANFKYGGTIFDDSSSPPSPNYTGLKRGLMTIYNDGQDEGLTNKRYAIILGSLNNSTSPSTEWSDIHKAMKIRHYYQKAVGPATLDIAYTNFDMATPLPSDIDADTGVKFSLMNKSAIAQYAGVSLAEKITFAIGSHEYLIHTKGGDVTPVGGIKSEGLIIRKDSGIAFARFGIGDTSVSYGTAGISSLIIDTGSNITNIAVDKAFIPYTTQSQALGVTSNKWNSLYISKDSNNDFTIDSDGRMILNNASGARANMGVTAGFDLRLPNDNAISDNGLFLNEYGSLAFGPVSTTGSSNDWENGIDGFGAALHSIDSRSFTIHDTVSDSSNTGNGAYLSGLFVDKVYNVALTNLNGRTTGVYIRNQSKVNNAGYKYGAIIEMIHTDAGVSSGDYLRDNYGLKIVTNSSTTDGWFRDHFGADFDTVLTNTSATNAYGLNVNITNSGSSVITNSYGLKIYTSGNATNSYGLYMDNDGTNSYGIYQVTADKNYFSGNVGIGVLIPTEALEVDGNTVITGILDARYDTGSYVSATMYTNADTRHFIASGEASGTRSTLAVVSGTATFTGDVLRITQRGAASANWNFLSLIAQTSSTQKEQFHIDGLGDFYWDQSNTKFRWADHPTDNGYDFDVLTGNGTTDDKSGGDIFLKTGTGFGIGTSGNIQINSNNSTDTTGTGYVYLYTGEVTGSSAAGNSGALSIYTGETIDGDSGALSIATGRSNDTGTTGIISIATGRADDNNSGALIIRTGYTGNSHYTGDMTIGVGNSADNRHGTLYLQPDGGKISIGSPTANYGILNIKPTGNLTTSIVSIETAGSGTDTIEVLYRDGSNPTTDYVKQYYDPATNKFQIGLEVNSGSDWDDFFTLTNSTTNALIGIGQSSPARLLHVGIGLGVGGYSARFDAQIEVADWAIFTTTANGIRTPDDNDAHTFSLTFKTGANSGAYNTGGINIYSGNTTGGSLTGDVNIYSGNNTATVGGEVSGDINIYTGTAANGIEGVVNIQANGGITKFGGVVNFKPMSAPSSPVKGDAYYDSGDDILKIWNGSVWKDCYA